eukprot:6459317-Amphidinium_carterae.1
MPPHRTFSSNSSCVVRSLVCSATCLTTFRETPFGKHYHDNNCHISFPCCYLLVGYFCHNSSQATSRCQKNVEEIMQVKLRPPLLRQTDCICFKAYVRITFHMPNLELPHTMDVAPPTGKRDAPIFGTVRTPFS